MRLCVHLKVTRCEEKQQKLACRVLRRCAAVGVEQPLRDAEMCMYGISLTHISQADYE